MDALLTKGVDVQSTIRKVLLPIIVVLRQAVRGFTNHCLELTRKQRTALEFQLAHLDAPMVRFHFRPVAPGIVAIVGILALRTLAEFLPLLPLPFLPIG